MVKAKQAVFILILLFLSAAVHADTTITLPGTLNADYAALYDGSCAMQPDTWIIDNEPGVIVDDSSAGWSSSGSWTEVNFTGDDPINTRWHIQYHWASVGGGSDTATWTPNILEAGTYDVFYFKGDYGTTATHSRNQPFHIYYSGGDTGKTTDTAQGGTLWYFGSYSFAAGTGGYVTTTDDGASDTYVNADMMYFRKNRGVSPIIIERNENGGAGYSSDFTDLDQAHYAHFNGDLDYTLDTSPADKSVTFTPTISTAGWYATYMWVSREGVTVYCDSQTWSVTHADGTTSHEFDMDQEADNGAIRGVPGGTWRWIGTYRYAAGTGGYVTTDNECNTGTGTIYCAADAIMFDYMGPNLAGNWQPWVDDNTNAQTGYNCYITPGNGGTGTYFRWNPTLDETATYAIYVRIPHLYNITSDTSVTYKVHSENADYTTTAIDHETAVGLWQNIGYYILQEGANCYLELNADQGSANYIIADAVKFVKMNKAGVETQANILTERFNLNPDFKDQRWQSWTDDSRDYDMYKRGFVYDGRTAAGSILSYYIFTEGDPIVLNDDDAAYVGSWTNDGVFGGFENDTHRIDESPGCSPCSTATWTPTISSDGDYLVELFFPAISNVYFADDAPFTVVYAGDGGGSTTIDFAQNIGNSVANTSNPTNHYRWNYHGIYPFTAGTGNSIQLSNDAEDAVVADAVRVQKVLKIDQDGNVNSTFRLNWNDDDTKFVFGFFDSAGGSIGADDSVYVYFGKDQSPCDVTIKIYDGANTDTTTINRVLRPGQDYDVTFSYTAAAGATLVITDANSDTEIINTSVPLSNVSAFTINSFGFGSLGTNDYTNTDITDLKIWTGTSETYKTVSKVYFPPISIDATTISTNNYTNIHRDEQVYWFPMSYTPFTLVQGVVKYGDYTYISFLDNQLRSWVVQYDHTLNTISNPAFTGLAVDGHGMYGLVVSGYDDKLHCVGGAHGSDLRYFRGSIANSVEGLNERSKIDNYYHSYTRGAWIDDGSTYGKLLWTYRTSLTDSSARTDPAWAYSTDNGDTWTTGFIFQWEGYFSSTDNHNMYPISSDVSEDGVYYLTISYRNPVSADFFGGWTICYDGTNWMNPAREVLTLPLCVPGVDTTINAFEDSNTDITISPDPGFVEDIFIGKWVYHATAGWIQLTGNDSNTIETDTDLVSAGMSTTDAIFIGEKNIEVYWDSTLASARSGGFRLMSVQGSGTTPQIFTVAGNVPDEPCYVYKYNYSTGAFDETLISTDFGVRSIVAQDANNIVIYGTESDGNEWDYVSYNTDNGGSSWSGPSSAIHEPYWGYSWQYRGYTGGSPALPGHDIITDDKALLVMHNVVWPQVDGLASGNYMDEWLMPSSNYLWGTSNPTYLENHRLSSIEWDGSGLVYLMAAETQRDLQEVDYFLNTASFTQVTDGDTDFTDVGNYDASNHVMTYFDLGNSGAYNYIDNLSLIVGGLPIQPMFFHYNMMRKSP